MATTADLARRADAPVSRVSSVRNGAREVAAWIAQAAPATLDALGNPSNAAACSLMTAAGLSVGIGPRPSGFAGGLILCRFCARQE